jgi:hypothetical protein
LAGSEIEMLSEKKTCDRSFKHAASPYGRKIEESEGGEEVVKRLKFDSNKKNASSSMDRST